MNERNRLIEILSSFPEKECSTEDVADYLLANGVIVPPVAVGQTVYVIVASFVVSFQVEKIEMTEQGNFFGSYERFYWYSFDEIGKTVFLSREDAEKALAERKEK